MIIMYLHKPSAITFKYLLAVCNLTIFSYQVLKFSETSISFDFGGKASPDFLVASLGFEMYHLVRESHSHMPSLVAQEVVAVQC